MSGPIPVPPASPPGPISVRPGPSGPPGPPGPPGLGVPAGGTTGQVLTKDSAADYDTSWQDPTGGGGGGATNLSIANRGATTLDIASSTGTDATVPAATDSLAGLMVAADKAKLDGVAAGATALALGSTPGAALGSASAGSATTAARSDHVHPPSPPATGSAAGLMSAADKTKLDGIEAGAQVNVPTNLDYTAATRLLASSTGDDVTLPLFTSINAGLVPASGGGTTNFLRADGGWVPVGALNNLTATSAPTAGDDSADGYAVGSRWLWAARGLEWVALDVTVGAAVWMQQGAWVATGGAGAQGSALAQWGAFSITSSGTESNIAVSSSNPPLRRYTTAATTNAEAQLSERNGGGILSASIPTAAKRVRMIFRLPDASYGSGATGTRIALGIDTPLSIGWLTAANGNATDRGFWLRWDTNAGDTNWQLVIRTTGTPGDAVITDTGILAEPGWYEFCCEHSGAGSTVRMMFGRLNAATFRSVASIPDGRFIPAIGLRTLSAVARAMDLASIVYQERGQW